VSIPKSFMGRCCTDRFYLDKCDCDKDKTMHVGDRVKLNSNRVFSKPVQKAFSENKGRVIAVHTEWDEYDMICWDVSVEMPDGRTFGFYFDDLVVSKDEQSTHTQQTT